MAFEFERQKISDLVLIKPLLFGDNRGYFMEIYKKSDFYKNGICDNFCQDNYSKSSRYVLRGLHYQEEPCSQAKLVRCVKGRIYDVVLDIRKNSETFGKYLGIELNDDNKYSLYIPKGFAHGFVVLSDEAEILYKTSNEYNPVLEKGIIWNDTDLNIDWGIDFEPVLSNKDRALPKFKEVFN